MSVEREEILKAKQQQAFNIYGNFIEKAKGFPPGTKRKWGKHWYEKKVESGWKYIGVDNKEVKKPQSLPKKEGESIKINNIKITKHGEYKGSRYYEVDDPDYKTSYYIRFSDHEPMVGKSKALSDFSVIENSDGSYVVESSEEDDQADIYDNIKDVAEKYDYDIDIREAEDIYEENRIQEIKKEGYKSFHPFNQSDKIESIIIEGLINTPIEYGTPSMEFKRTNE